MFVSEDKVFPKCLVALTSVSASVVHYGFINFDKTKLILSTFLTPGISIIVLRKPQVQSKTIKLKCYCQWC